MTLTNWHLLLAGMSVCVVLYVLYLLAHAAAFLRLWRRQARPMSPPKSLPKVAIVVPQRNEATNITRCLRALVRQNYPADRFQIIVVDDHSTDGSAALVEDMMEWHPGLIELIRLQGPAGIAQKKKAITAGIAASRAEYILTLDADCEPNANWLTSMMSCFRPGVAFLAGPIRKVPQAPVFLQQLQATESAGMVALAAGAIELGVPMMANGGNLGFRRAAFEQVAGYKGIDQVASGDDELLMHKMHHAFQGLQPTRPVAYCLAADAIVETPALTNWRALREQRIRWVSKSRAYHHPRMTLAQINAYLANLTLVLAVILWLFLPQFGTWAAVLWGAKILAELCVLVPALWFLRQLHLLPWAVLGQPVHVLYVLWVGVAGSLARSYQWKGRVVR